MNHVNYPHEPGTLYDCAACEDECNCTATFQCVGCAILEETGQFDCSEDCFCQEEC